MKKWFAHVASLLACTTLAFALASPRARAASTPKVLATAAPALPVATVPVGVEIPVELTQRLSSLAEHAGDTFTFKTRKDESLGTTLVPAGTSGHGRIAVASAAHGRVSGTMSLQADSIDLPDGRTISVDIDNARPIRGHLSDTHKHFSVFPILIGIVSISRTSRDGNLVLDPGAPFDVITTRPRTLSVPPLTAAPSPQPSATP